MILGHMLVTSRAWHTNMSSFKANIQPCVLVFVVQNGYCVDRDNFITTGGKYDTVSQSR
jgi:hypothetical protein